MWFVEDAKARLFEVMRRARLGKPQVIGAHKPAVAVPADHSNAAMHERDGVRFLIETAPRGEPLELPPRGPDRADPFTRS